MKSPKTAINLYGNSIHLWAMLLLFWGCVGTCMWFGVQSTKTFKSSFVSWLPAESAERKNFVEISKDFGSPESLVVSWADCRIESSQLRKVEDELRLDNRWFKMIASGSSIDRTLGDKLGLSANVRCKRMKGFFRVGERKNFVEISKDFGSPESLVVSWADCRIESSQLRKVEDELRLDNRWFKMIASGSSIDRTLGDKLGLSANVRCKRMKGFFRVGDTGQTMLVFRLNEVGLSEREQAIDHVKRVLLDAQIAESDIHFGGPAYYLDQLNQESFWSPLRVAPAICVMSFLLCWALLGQFGIAFFINQLGVLVAMFSLSIVYFSGLPLNMIVWTLPTLTLLLTSSTALHFLAYYRESINEIGAEKAPAAAVRKFIQPAALCCLTSCVGLSSLMTSSIAPIFQFGMFGAISVCFSSLAVTLWLPAWLRIFPYRQKLGTGRGGHLWWSSLVASCTKLRMPIIFLTVTLLMYSVFLLPTLSVGAKPDFLFSSDSRYLQDQTWLDNNLELSGTTDLKLAFSNASSTNDLNRLKWLLKLQYEIRAWPEIKGVHSAGTFLPKTKPKRDSIIARFRERGIENRIKELKLELADAGLVSLKGPSGVESWLLSVKADDSSDQQELSKKLRTHIESDYSELSDKYFQQEQLQVSSSNFQSLTGYIEGRFQRELVVTYCTALCIICSIFLVVFRSWKLLLVSLIPNLLPALAVLGLVAFFRINLDVGSLITASVALGIAVDDTLHFLLWWRDKRQDGMETREATANTLKHCGLAMLQTTLVFGVGVSLYGLSSFLPTIRFGFLLASMMFFAIIGDLVVIPALLATRLGQIFSRDSVAQE